MALCKFSTEFVASNQTAIDNIFINDYLPYAPAECVRVYIYGLYKCANAESFDNSLASFAKILKMSESDIESCFLYWQDQGLVQVLPTDPIEIRFVPVSSALAPIKKFNKKKYENFNTTAQEILSGRMITPYEYAEYYTFLESLHMEETALIMIMHYSAKLKGNNVGYNYILTIAKNWAYEGVLTSADVEEKLKSVEALTGAVSEVLKALGIKRAASIEEKEMLKKWTDDLGFEFETIKSICKVLKNKPNPNFTKLDAKLMKYYELQLLSVLEIENYEKEKSEYLKTAKSINKSLGLYYENLETVVDNYIAKWYSFGYNSKALSIIASHSFKNSIRTLEGMDSILQKFYQLGLVSEKSINEHLEEGVAYDKKIKQTLESLGLSRIVTQSDRDCYKTWTENWNMTDELIAYASTLAKGKLGPMNYLNKVLSNWFENKITTLANAKQMKILDGEKNVKAVDETIKAKKKAEEIIKARRKLAEEIAAANVEEAMKNAEFKELYTLRQSVMISLARTDSTTDATKLKEINNKIAKTLKELGLTESDLSPKYTCLKCNDTGVCQGVRCDCIKQEIEKQSKIKEVEI